MPFASQIHLAQLPPWYENISRGALERAVALSQAQYAPFQGQRVAPLGDDLRRAEELSRREGLYLPYLQSAEQGFNRAATPFTQSYQAYMNPYQQSVLDRIRTEGLRTFNEGIMPALESRFVRGGHYGGGMHRQLAERAARDAQQAIGDRQQQALASGYQQAGQLHATDMARQMEAARQMGELGRQRQAGHLSDIAALEASGERSRGIRQQDLGEGYRDFLQQREYPWQQLSNLSGSIAGTPYSSQGLQYMHQDPQQQLNRSGQIGSLAGQLYGLNRASGNRGFKKGGAVKSDKLQMKSGLAALVKKKRAK